MDSRRRMTTNREIIYALILQLSSRLSRGKGLQSEWNSNPSLMYLYKYTGYSNTGEGVSPEEILPTLK